MSDINWLHSRGEVSDTWASTVGTTHEKIQEHKTLISGIIQKPKSLKEYIEMIEWPNGQGVLQMYDDNHDAYIIAQGSSHNHQAWEWGYYDHIKEVCFFAELYYNALETTWRKIDFSLWDAILTLFLHDLEKSIKYAGTSEQKKELDSFKCYQEFIFSKAKEYWIQLSDMHKNAIKYVHWELDDYSNLHRTQTPLAAFIHHCDNTSARIFSDYPLPEDRIANTGKE